MSRRHNGEDQTVKIHKKLDKIETEMRYIGLWDIPDPGPDAIKNCGAFGLNTMSFEQWLRWVFVPNVRVLLKQGGPWPINSQVGVAATKNLDGQPETSRLVTLLCEFDLLFKRG